MPVFARVTMDQTGVPWALVGVAASILAFVAGMILLTSDDPGDLGSALGVYFLAKAVFLGPMLYLTGRIAAQTGDDR